MVLKRQLPPVLLLLAPALLTVGAIARRWTCDDAFINYRVVQNLLAGHGPVYNVGERVETFTSPLWIGLLSIWGSIGSIEWGALGLSLAAATVGLFAAQAGALRLADREGFAVPAGALVVACLSPYWDFATSGLETGLTLAWLGTSFWAVARSERYGTTPVGVAVLLGLGPLVRPDLALFSVAFFVAFVRGGQSWIRSTIAFGTLPVLYQVFRMGYFAALVPNTALAKEAESSHWTQGGHFLWDFMGPYWLLVPLAAAAILYVTDASAIARKTSTRFLVLAVGSAAVIHALYIVRLGGGFMHARMLLPSLFGLLLPVMAVRLPLNWRRPRLRWRAVAWVLLVLHAAWAAVALRVPYEGSFGPHGIADERDVYVHMSRVSNPVTLDDYEQHPFAKQGHYLRTLLENATGNIPATRPLLLVALQDDKSGSWMPPEQQSLHPVDGVFPREVELIASSWNIGLVGYAAGAAVHVVDRHGLNDPVAGRLRLRARGRPGHEKDFTNGWLLARFAPATQMEGRSSRAQAAYAEIHASDTQQLLAAVRDPLTSSRFLANLAAAWRFHQFRLHVAP